MFSILQQHLYRALRRRVFSLRGGGYRSCRGGSSFFAPKKEPKRAHKGGANAAPPLCIPRLHIACWESVSALLSPLLLYRYDSCEAWFLCPLLLPVRSCYCPRSQCGRLIIAPTRSVCKRPKCEQQNYRAAKEIGFQRDESLWRGFRGRCPYFIIVDTLKLPAITKDCYPTVKWGQGAKPLARFGYFAVLQSNCPRGTSGKLAFSRAPPLRQRRNRKKPPHRLRTAPLQGGE